MKRNYVILSTPGKPRARMRGMTPAGLESSPQPPKVDVSALDPKTAADVASKKSVKAVAPVIPMKMIAPVSLDNEAPAVMAAEAVPWGIKAVGANTSPFNGDGIVVAVLDSGIDPTHPAFNGVELVRRNFTQEGDDDQDGHGTHCAGTIFGRDVDGTRIGVATGVKKAFIGKVLGKGGGGSDQVVQAIQWAITGGANVISMSLGIDFPGYVKELEGEGMPTELATSMALEDYRLNILLFENFASFISAQNAFLGASLLIAAAGNESRRQIDPDFEIAVSPPAVADGFVSVAALGTSAEGFTVAPFSNWGARVSGPGVGIISAKTGGGLTSKNGTSMATPHVAGVAALWAQKLSATGELNGKLLADKLLGNATTNGIKPGFAPRNVGAGMVQAPQN
jgi:subtilisin family serine protease